MALASGILKKTSGYNADPAHIVRRKDWNPRFDFGGIEELQRSIKENGFSPAKPLLVKRNAEGKLEIIDGDRRFTAVENLIKKGHIFEDGIPIVIEDKNIEDVDALILMFTANLGKPFLPLEEAVAFKRMRDAGLSVKQIMSRTGKSDTHINETLALVEADPSVQKALQEGKLNSTMAKSIANKAKGNKEVQKELVTEASAAKGDKVKQREVKEKVQAMGKKAKRTGLVSKPMVPLRHTQLEVLVHKVQKAITQGLTDCGQTEATLKATIKDEDAAALAYHQGVMAGLRAALGYPGEVVV